MKLIKRDPNHGYLDTWLWAPKKRVNVDALKSSLSIALTDSYTGNQKVLKLWEEEAHHLKVPRMLWNPSALTFTVIDCRPQLFKRVAFKSRIKLDHRPALVDGEEILAPTGDNVQKISLKAMQGAMGGVLQLSCGRGKSVIALEHIAINQCPALIVLDNTNLLYQWEREIETLLDVPGGVGYLMGGKDDWEGRGIVLATYQTLGARAYKLPEEFKRYFGSAYYDEGHHASAPMFSRGVSIIYGRRYSLTATPERDDGQHIIADFHIGPVVHKDLRPMMKPNIFFYWTGLELELTDPDVQRDCFDVNGELHLSKIRSYLGTWRKRMEMLLSKAKDAVSSGRKVLLLTDSVSEVISLLAMWTRGVGTPLYSGILKPQPHEIGEVLQPLELDKKMALRTKVFIEKYWKQVKRGALSFEVVDGYASVTKGSVNMGRLQSAMEGWQRHLVHKKIQSVLRKRQKEFLKKLLSEESTAGAMTYGIEPRARQRFLDEKDVVFAITKYGKEGLDCEALDTVLVSSIFSSKNGLQQLKGRPTRPKPGKKTPTIVLFVDAIGQMRGMEQKLMKHLRQWPHDEGGPYDFDLINYPKEVTCKISTLKTAFGQ